ncbi:F-box associated domain containing protein [Tanacetum coccineum]
MVKFCNQSDDYLELGVAGEWLCVLHHYCESPVVDVWVMKVYEVKDSWTKFASIPYPDHCLVSPFPPLGLADNNGDED